MLLRFCRLLLLTIAVHSPFYLNLCQAIEEASGNDTLSWRSSFRSVESVPLREICWWENYLPNIKRDSEILVDEQSSLTDGLSEKLIDQTTNLLLPLSNQLGSLSDDIVTQVINILFSVETSLRENFIKNVIEKEIFHPSHPLHQRTYNLDRAINYLGSLALTFTRGGSSRISFLDNTSPIPPAVQQIISVW